MGYARVNVSSDLIRRAMELPDDIEIVGSRESRLPFEVVLIMGHASIPAPQEGEDYPNMILVLRRVAERVELVEFQEV